MSPSSTCTLQGARFVTIHYIVRNDLLLFLPLFTQPRHRIIFPFPLIRLSGSTLRRDLAPLRHCQQVSTRVTVEGIWGIAIFL
jgi:hypothetical protein